MKKIILPFLLAIILFISHSQIYSQVVWSKNYGGTLEEAPGIGNTAKTSIALSSDGKSIYFATTTESSDGDISGVNMGQRDGWIVKLNENGDTLWTDILGGSRYDDISDITATPDGGCIVCGSSNSVDGDFEKANYHYNPDIPDYIFTDGYIAKYSADGKQEWIKMYGGQPLWESTYFGIDELYKIIVTKDGNYFAVGYTYSETDDLPIDYDKFGGAWVLKVDPNGKIINSDRFVGANHNENNSNRLLDIIETSENVYYALGEQDYNKEDVYGNLYFETFIWAIKTDGYSILKENEYGLNNYYTQATQILQGKNNTLLISGSIQASGGDIDTHYGYFDFWVGQLDNNLALEDQKTYGGSDSEVPFAFVSDNLGHYLLLGASKSTDIDAQGAYGDLDFWGLNFDENFDILQTIRMGGSASDALTDAVFSADGKTLYLAGRTESTDIDIKGTKGLRDVWIAKTTQDPTLSVNSLSETNDESYIFPNPSNGKFFVSGHKSEQIEISDITGKIVYKSKILTDNEQIDLGRCNKGVYFGKFSNNQICKIVIN